MEKTTKTSIEKLDEQIKSLSSRNKKTFETTRINKKDLVKKAKQKELEDKIEKNKKKNNKRKKNNKKNTKSSKTKKIEVLENTTTIDINEIKLENKIRNLYNDTEKTIEIEILNENEDDTLKIPIVDNMIDKFDEKLASVKILGDDAYSKLIIFLFYVFMFLVLFYLIFFMAISFA